MKKLMFLAVGMVAVLLAGGCRVEERMVWSPDGSRAAVRVGDQLCLMDPDGKLSPPLASNVTAVAWLPDGKSLVLVRSLSMKTWAEGARLLPSNEVATVESLARGLLDTAKGALAAADCDASAVEEKFIKPLNISPSESVIPALICLYDGHKAEVEQLIRGAKNNADAEKALAEPHDFTIHELAIYPAGGGAPQVLEHTLLDLMSPRVSSSQGLVAYVRGEQLIAAPLAGGTNRAVVAERVVGVFDWTPDGQALLYAAPDREKWEENAVNLFQVVRRGVTLEQGQVKASVGLRYFARAASSFAPRVRCLPDGRVLFASLALQLPAAVEPGTATHFYLADGDGAPTAIATPPEALPQDLAAFAPSPDGKRIALVSACDDEVKLVEIASGKVTGISPQRIGKSRTLPAWRGTNELFFAAFPAADSQRPEWLRWSPGAAPCVISAQWPAGAVTNLLGK